MRSPGVYKEEVLQPPPRATRTGVPAFVGLAATGPVALADTFVRWRRLRELLEAGDSLSSDDRALRDALRLRVRLGDWAGAEDAIADGDWATFTDALRVESFAEFRDRFGPAVAGGFLSEAVRAFFGSGGGRCYVLRLAPGAPSTSALRSALGALELLDEVDLVCAPDIARPIVPRAEAIELEREIVDRCDRGGRRFAVLDSLPSGDPVAQADALRSANAALYHPWVRPTPGPDGDPGFVPPCGHVAGVIARTDARVGVHKAPANEPLAMVLDLQASVDAAAQAEMNAAGVNVIRAFPGRGIRVWGARTLSTDGAWTYVPVRRLFLTAARWIEREFDEPLFEPADRALRARVELRLTQYFDDLFRRGALKGATREEAYYVRCDEETNPPSEQDAGRVVAEIGLAPASPSEFVVLQITRDATGVSIAGPSLG